MTYMTWYAAHLVMMVELKDRPQKSYPVWENVLLIEAATKAAAFEKAEEHGRAEEGDEDGSFRWGASPPAGSSRACGS